MKKLIYLISYLFILLVAVLFNMLEILLEHHHKNREICTELIEIFNVHFPDVISKIIYNYVEPTLNANEVSEFASKLSNRWRGNNFVVLSVSRIVIIYVTLMMCVNPKRLIELGCDPFLPFGMAPYANMICRKFFYANDDHCTQLAIEALVEYFKEPVLIFNLRHGMSVVEQKIILPDNFVSGFLKINIFLIENNFTDFKLVITTPGGFDPEEKSVTKEELDNLSNSNINGIIFRGRHYGTCIKGNKLCEVFKIKVHCYYFKLWF